MKILAATAAACALLLTACGDADTPSDKSSAADPASHTETSPAESESTEAPPSTGTTGTTGTAPARVVTTIPDEIPLGMDLWDARGDGGEYHAVPYRPAPDEQGSSIDPCGTAVWPLGGTLDEQWAWATGPEYADRREVVTLPSVDAAVDALEAIRQAVEACPTDEKLVWSNHDLDTGYDSVTFSLSYDSLGLRTYLVTRVANAVLLTDVYGEGHISHAEDSAVARIALTQTLAPYLCVFAAARCGGAQSPTQGLAIPDDFPLADGWPRRTGEPGYAGLTGPNRTLPALDLAPCDVQADDPEYADRLRADWSDVEDFRHRQLTVYGSEAIATSALLSIVELHRSCPETHHDGGFTTHFTLDQTSYGDESWSVVATETQAEGYPTSYLNVSHFVRVGSAVLVDTVYSEGGAGPPGSLERNVRRPAAEAESVISTMCTFTDLGC